MRLYNDEVNYVGSFRVEGPRTIYGANINRCAYHHDRYYDNHRFTRKEADKRMLACFLKKIKRKEMSKRQEKKAIRVAKIFYGLVRFFGAIPYHKACRKLKRKEGEERDG